MFELPQLPYGYAALEPDISEATLRTHHGKHHARYVAATNALLAESGATPDSLETVVAHAARDGVRLLFNNAAQAWNHAFFWECMDPAGSRPARALGQAIEAQFGGLDELEAAFMAEANGHFGSGWAWLIVKQGRLGVISTHDADTAAVLEGVTPLLVCDLWEHAYYLDHRNDRVRFLTAWWRGLANWPFAGRQYAAANGVGKAWRYPLPAQSPRAHPEPDTASPTVVGTVEASSPACYAAEVDGAYMGYLDREGLAGELNTLLEAERAGAAVAARLVAEARDAELKALARVIHDDEVRWCRELIAALGDLKAEPSQAIGGFYDQAMAIPDIEARLAFVNRGQDWVVRRLRGLLPRVRSDTVHLTLRQMLEAHERNIASANATLEARPTLPLNPLATPRV